MHESLVLLIAVAVLAVPALAIAALVFALKAGTRCEELARRVDALAREVRMLRLGERGSREGVSPPEGAAGAAVEGAAPPRRGEDATAGEQTEEPTPGGVERRSFSLAFLEEPAPYRETAPPPVVAALRRRGFLPPPTAEAGTRRVAGWWALRGGLLAAVAGGWGFVFAFVDGPVPRVIACLAITAVPIAVLLYLREDSGWVEGRPVPDGAAGSRVPGRNAKTTVGRGKKGRKRARNRRGK